MDFSEKLKKYREDNNLTQEELGEKLGVSRQSISKWETSDSYPSYEILMDISKLLNESIDDLLSKRDIVHETIRSKNHNKKLKIIGFSALGFVAIATGVSAAAIVISNKNSETINSITDNKPCEHSFGSYTYNQDCSCEQAGTKTSTCKLCGLKNTVEDEEHPILYHNIVTEEVIRADRELPRITIKCKNCSYTKLLTYGDPFEYEYYTVDDDNNVSRISYSSELDSYFTRETETTKYDSDGNQIVNQTIEACYNKSWVVISDFEYKYNPEGRKILNDKNYWSFDDDGERYLALKEKYVLNDDGFILYYETRENWNEETNTWKINKLETATYNDINKQLTKEIYNDWDSEKSEWICKSKEINEYNDNGKLVSVEFHDNWDKENNKFLTNTKETYSYDYFDNVILYELYEYDSEDKWTMKEKRIREYDSTGKKCVNSSNYKYSELYGGWILTKRGPVYTNDLNDGVTKEFTYILDDGEWIELKKSEVIDTEEVYSYSSYVYSKESHSYIGDYRRYEEYYEYGGYYQDYSVWSTDTNSWKTLDKDICIRNEYENIVRHEKCVLKSFYGYDNNVAYFTPMSEIRFTDNGEEEIYFDNIASDEGNEFCILSCYYSECDENGYIKASIDYDNYRIEGLILREYTQAIFNYYNRDDEGNFTKNTIIKWYYIDNQWVEQIKVITTRVDDTYNTEYFVWSTDTNSWIESEPFIIEL